MSYILEALRRADAERRRGAVPGLHAQPSGGVSTDREPSGRIGPLALIGAAVVMVLAGASGAWWWAVQRPIAPTPAPTPAPVPAPIATPSASPAPPPVVATALPARPEPAPASTPAVDRAATPPVVLPAESATAPPLPAVPAPALPRARPGVAAASPAGLPASRLSAAASSLGAVARANAAPDPVASAPPARLPLLAELPEALRREMAGLSINGSVYAEQPAARLVILNGQVFREGESPATDLRIEQIRPRSVVFNLRGQRFEMPM